MDGVNQNNINQNNQAQQAPDNKSDPNKQHVSDKQANDFADKLNKEKKKKPEGNKEDQSLESLLTEHRKNSKNAVGERLKEQHKDQHKDSQKEGGQGELLHKDNGSNDPGLTRSMEAQVKTDIQIREMQQVQSVKEVNAALQKMADQIHVSAKDAVNGAEIRITLKDSILPDTEIRIQRVAGELNVTLNTKSAEANNFLAAHEASLQKTLAEKFGNEKVQVNINLSGGDNNQEDGRSRNEYIAPDDDHSNDE